MTTSELNIYSENFEPLLCVLNEFFNQQDQSRKEVILGNLL